MFLAIIIINVLSLLTTILILGAAKKAFVKRRYLLCTLMHHNHPPAECKNVPMKMGPVTPYLLLNATIFFLSFFIYFV